jgi:hypothetical protein
MLVNKVTTGFVIQVFDTELKRFISQEFVASDQCQYEDKEGVPVCSEALEVDGKEAYLPFQMIQPQPSRPPKKCVRVEYDLNFWGGDYSGVGQFAYVPLETIDRLPGDDPDGKLKTAFTVLVGDPRHIVHYTFDEPTDQDGNEWREDR